MFTPQQIDQISFERATFGGYNMASVDEFLEPLTEDYVTLYKENALLKSKMRVLVGKLEEYRKNDAAMKAALAEAQKAADKAVLEVQNQAPAAVDVSAMVAAEKERVDEARKLAASKIDEIQNQMRSCIQALDRIKAANKPRTPAAAPVAEEAPVQEAAPVQQPAPEAPKTDADAVAEEISHSLEALVGTTVDTAPKAEPRHPLVETTTAKFANLQFGRNYDPNHK